MAFLLNKKEIISISILGAILSSLLSGMYFRFSYFEADTVSYLFQAKLFASGKLSTEAPPDFGFSPSIHLNILNDKWYSKYPFGNSLMLTLGEIVGYPWLVPGLLTGFTLFLLHLIVCETHGPRLALLASIVALASPATLVMGATWFSEVVSRFWLGVYLLGIIRTLKGGRWIYPMLSGFALGYAFNTRPMTSILFGLAGAGLCVGTCIKDSVKSKDLLRSLFIFLIPFVLMIIVCFAWNSHLTGNALRFTHNAAQPLDTLGFGKRSEGNVPNVAQAYEFTATKAFLRIWSSILPSISYHTLGWGYYQPGMIQSIVKSVREGRYKDLLLIVCIIPLAFSLILMLIPVFHSSRNQYDLFFLSLLLINLLLYYFFYFEASTWGFPPTNSRYYNESILLGVLPLIARGILITHRWLRLRGLHIVAGLLLVVLSANALYSYVRFGTSFRGGWFPVYWELPQLVKESQVHHAVIFVPGVLAPIGDYPFRNLEDADIVYFRLGPSEVWRLTNSDWHNIYEEYFKGRRAYLFESGQLQSLPVKNTDVDETKHVIVGVP
jgi:hypothetical protein